MNTADIALGKNDKSLIYNAHLCREQSMEKLNKIARSREKNSPCPKSGK